LIQVGDLMQINLLDTRQFRDKKDLCRKNLDTGFGFGNYREQCDALRPNDRSMLGSDQEKWLERNFANNRATWNVLASSGPFLPFRLLKDGKQLRYIGAWDAYPANRRRLVGSMFRAAGHPLVLSGDIHSFWAIDGALDPVTSDRIPIVEFVTSSLSANWPEPLSKPMTDNLAHNPQVQLYDGNRRGYLLHEVNKREWKTTMRTLDNVKDNH
jgi:alkaline phosphatase D